MQAEFQCHSRTHRHPHPSLIIDISPSDKGPHVEKNVRLNDFARFGSYRESNKQDLFRVRLKLDSSPHAFFRAIWKSGQRCRADGKNDSKKEG
jgi:hypothetical protein